MKKGSPEYYKLGEHIASLIEAHPPRSLSQSPLEVPDLEFINEMLDKEIDRNLHPEPCNLDEDGVGCKPQDNDH